MDTLRSVLTFLEAYRTAFERFDTDAIVDLYALPAHIVSDGEPVALRPFTDAASCREGVQFVLDRHRRLGVRSGRLLEFALVELAPAIAVFRLHFEFHGRACAPLYDYQGVYTLVRKGAGWGVAAIAHNQIPRLTAALAASGQLSSSERAGRRRGAGWLPGGRSRSSPTKRPSPSGAISRKSRDAE